ncbi:thioredoxin family protein [Tenacibaculum maritimum]|uniref:Thioredoxin family protein n=2 Tax=Tenacibaculum maritimum TaxID=107401 RepID=A0A2H1EDG9_9FLAO|nr:thioredoxin family protein [Tenacibaculum maritimum]MCD9562136.1 thioredoxin family protein [Tenacibaculum maritimum]MCD9565655.1 thioredoxin family protein [Tenacibaculum maritimum]MCD9578524.1 thioredoxin family protein [Tenacibaculum maritimum]MCD9584713.1 thioredoxin family protein [Tenacibaculum maritimum]MCD9596419.1 thioredoxin family protein [Tenacibaculum maritimum]
MKNIILTLFFFISTFLNAQKANGIIWHDNIEVSVKRALKENKQVLVYFSGSDWCKPCMELKTKVFDSTFFKKEVENKYVLVNIDFVLDRKKLTKEHLEYIEKSAEKYNEKGAFPLVIILSKKGKVIQSIDGYKSETAEYYVNTYLK